MFRPRVIPILLLKGEGLVKSVGFKNHNYIGDPINAVKLFNDLEADELIFLDILASRYNKVVSTSFVERIGKEANMPFAVGGGINSVQQIRNLLQAGAEKVVINSAAYVNPDLIRLASREFGSSTIVVSMDVKYNWLKKRRIYINSAQRVVKGDILEWVRRIEDLGAGELMITSVDHEGKMAGMDVDLVKLVSQAVKIPVIAHGGASELSDCVNVCKQGYASAVAAGSLFVYQGPRKGVLINYPERSLLNTLFRE